MSLNIINNLSNRYGPIASGFSFEIDKPGYSVLVGRNNTGKSCLLQLIYKEVFGNGVFAKDSIAYISADRPYIRNTTQPPNTLVQHNSNLYSIIHAGPRTYAAQQVPESDSLYSLFLHRHDFIRQFNEINRFMLRLGFDEIVLNSTQTTTIKGVHVISQGTGVRSVLP